MKIIQFKLVLIFLTINLYADKNWIEIDPKAKKDVDLAQIEPINKILRKATFLKQLVEATGKKEKVETNDKNWFILNSENDK